MARTRQPEDAAKIEEWNSLHGPGTAVGYHSVVSQRGFVWERTRTAAVLLPGGTPGVWITRHQCAVAIAKLHLIDDAAVPPLEELLIRRTDALLGVENKAPAVKVCRFTFQHLYRGRINPNAPYFPVLPFYAL